MRRKTLFWTMLCGYGALFTAVRLWMALMLPWPGPLVERDFTNLWMAGRLAARGHVDQIYDIAAFHSTTVATLATHFPNNYSYPPHALFLAIPFGLMPYAVALTAWNAISLVMFYVAARPYCPRELPRWVILVSPPALICLFYGHYGLIFGALWLWAFRGSGLSAAALTMKPHLGLLVAVRMLSDRKAMITAVLTTMALLIASVLLFGISSWEAFLTSTLTYQVDLLHGYNAGRHMAMVGAYITYGFVGQVLFGGAALYLLRRRFDVFTAATATFLIVPYAFHYDLTVVSFGFAVLLAHHWGELRPWERLSASAAFLVPALVYFGSWIAPPLLLLGLFVQVSRGSHSELDLSRDTALRH